MSSGRRGGNCFKLVKRNVEENDFKLLTDGMAAKMLRKHEQNEARASIENLNLKKIGEMTAFCLELECWCISVSQRCVQVLQQPIGR